MSLSLSCKFSYFLLDFDLLEKKTSVKLFSFLKSSHFCTITSIFWQTCLQAKLIYNLRFPIWNKIHDQHPSKIPDQELFIPDRWSITTDNNRPHLIIHGFLNEIGNNIRASFSFNTVVACFRYFNINIFSAIIPLAFDNDNVSLIQIFRLQNWDLFVIFFFSIKL